MLLGLESVSRLNRACLAALRRPGRHGPIAAMSVTLADLDAMPADRFAEVLGGVFEHSPWVPAAAAASRPFASVDALHQAMVAAVAAAGTERQLALLEAHPDLAGRLARAGTLTAASAGEQAAAGLDRLDDDEFAWFEARNRAYRARFGFPFIIAVKAHSKDAIKRAFEIRLGHDRAQEMAAALAEVAIIARIRLAALIQD